MRQIVLDTETTGLEITQGHRIIEIGCVELVNRRPTGRHFHQYLNPDRDIDAGASAVHGLLRERLATAPRFGEIAHALLEFIAGGELVIHNAAFDLAFLDMELALLVRAVSSTAPADGENLLPSSVSAICSVLDTLALARERHPGQRNNLDALCKRYGIDATQRDLHGALLDARLLADVYLAMTGGQSMLAFEENALLRDGVLAAGATAGLESPAPLLLQLPQPLRIVEATALELAAHAQLTALLHKASGGRCMWSSVELKQLQIVTTEHESDIEIPALIPGALDMTPQVLTAGFP